MIVWRVSKLPRTLKQLLGGVWGRGEPTYHNSALFIRQVCVGVTASNQYFLLQDWFIICFVASLLAWEYLQLKNVLIKLVIILLCEMLHDSFIISCTEATKILKKVWCILIVLFGKAECPVCLVGKCWRHADNLSNRPCVGESIWGHSLPPPKVKVLSVETRPFRCQLALCL